MSSMNGEIKMLLGEIRRMRGLHKIAKSMPWGVVKISQLKKKHNVTNDSCAYVLGSASSISRLNDKFWDDCKSGFSIGINFWLIHDFVPDVLMAESSHDVDRNSCFSVLTQARKYDYSNVDILCHFAHQSYGRPQMLDIDSSLQGNIRLCPRWLFPTLSAKTLAFNLILWNKLLWSMGPYHGIASVVAATSLAISMGCRKIIIAGVDLNHTEYFWENNAKYDLLPKPKKIEMPGLHYVAKRETVANDHNQLPILDQLLTIQKTLLDPVGGKIISASRDSILSEFFPTDEQYWYV